MANILVCDDEKDIVSALQIYLGGEGYHVLTAMNGKEAVAVVEKEEVHLVLLDIMMPEMDGITAMAKIREISNVPIIMLTAKVEDTAKIMGLTIGADDYITKPFNPLEVVARVKTQLRRYVRYNHQAKGAEHVTEHDIRGLLINKDTHKCRLYGREITLTPIEFSIL